jgi:serine/threonine-protein kinase
VSVLDCGEIDGETPYIVMERLDGEDLRHLLAKEGRLSVYRTLRFALDACAGLSAVHAVGLVHRDLKPANLFVTRSKTRGELCKILDFGVAKGQTSEVTSQGALLGTVRYMAPEQLSNSASVSASTDVYAVGGILFECLAGRPAHDAETPEELMFDILNRDPPLASELRPELSPELADVIACAMARRQNERYESVGELALELERLLPAKDSDETAHDLSQPVRRPPRSRRRVSRTNVVVAAAVAGGIALGFSFAKLGERAAPSVENQTGVALPEARSPVVPAQSPARFVEPQTVVAAQPALGSHANPAGTVFETPTGAVAARNPPARTTSSAGAKSRAQKDGATPVDSAPTAKDSRPNGPVVLDVKNPYEE